MLIAGAFWLLLVLATWPVGEFPLNDDWIYAGVVRTLVREGHIDRVPYAKAAYVAQAVWGALFCLPAGWSYTALRVSTALLGLVGVLFTFVLLRQAGADRRMAALGAATLG